MADHQNCRAWNCRTWKWRTKNDGRERSCSRTNRVL